MTFDRSMKTQYFGFQSAAVHADGCPLQDTALWETTIHRQGWAAGASGGSRDETRDQTTVRFLCRECGTVAFERFAGPSSFEGTSVREVGYGTRPESVCGLWLHAGPRFLHGDQRGPQGFYVAASKQPPRAEAELVGAVSWYLTRRGAIRWHAKAGEESADDFKSRRAAVQWITHHHTEGARA